jgi:hypothetical protein
MDRRLLLLATAAGTAAQLAMVVTGHYSPYVAENFFAAGGLLFSLLAGFGYARAAQGGWVDSIAGGVVAGALCAFFGIGVSVLLGDVPTSLLAFGTGGSAATGLLGGVLGRLLAPRSSRAE